MDPFALAPVGRTGLRLPRLGLGTAPLGGWPEAVSYEQGVATVRRAWDRGIRYVDTAPFYGSGKSEEIIGRALRGEDRGGYRLSTKVGRVLVTGAPAGSLYQDGRPYTPVFDYTPAGVAASLAGSRERLGIAAPDLVLIHDPDEHQDAALAGAYPALAELRAAGEIGAVGVGINTVAPLLRFAEAADFDCFLLAGRYTLLEQTALDELFPLLAERGISVIAGGVFNSGLLADPTGAPMYDYARAPAELVAAAGALAAVCAGFGVPLRAAALQFAAAHPVVGSVVVGARTPAEVDDTLAIARLPIPGELWDALRQRGLLRPDAPTPPAG
jgi:D-threo-aldose 1-dehydrogenase